MATKQLHSMIFPGLADSYSVPQQATELSDFDNFVKAGLAIVSNGDTHLAIPADMYVYVYNHNTLDNGLYQNISGATIPASATLTTSNVSQVTGGGLNVLKNTLTDLENDFETHVEGTKDQSTASTVQAAFESTVDGISPGEAQYLVSMTKGGKYLMLIQKYTTNSYASYLAISYNSDKPLYGRRVNGVWTHYTIPTTQIT